MADTHAVVVADPDGVIRYWSAGAEQLFGYSAGEVVGESLDLIVPPEFRERHWSGFRDAVATGVCKLDRATTNVPVLCKDGTIQPFPGRFVFLQGARSDVVGVAALALVAALPIAVAGIGTSQVAFVCLFRHWVSPDVLLACSLVFSVTLGVMRAGFGLLFARELVSEARGAQSTAEYTP